MQTVLKILSLCAVTLLVSFAPHTPSQSLCHITDSHEDRIPVNAGSGIDQATFNRVIDNFTAVYKPIVKENGFKLSIVRKWSDETVNANTTVSGSSWVINAYGGLARYPTMDYNSFLMVMCHEMGHHLGGYPANDWASNEGQSDYYATMKCFRRMADAGFVDNVNDSNVSKSVRDACSANHKTKDAICLCEKGAETGYTLANILNMLGKGKPINFDTPDKNKVNHTDDSHPDAQCRLDTYYAGAVCGVSHSIEFSRNEPKTGACSEEGGTKIAVRPNCWYFPAL